MSNKNVNQQINWNVNQIAKKIRMLRSIAKEGDLTEEDAACIDTFVNVELEALINVVDKQAEGEFVEPEFNIEDK